MLSKEDYKKYLEQLLEIEKKMGKVYGKCADGIEDAGIKEVLTGLLQDEQGHAAIVIDMMKIIGV